MSWTLHRLEDVCDIKTGKSNTQDADPNGDYPFFDRSSEIKLSSRFVFDQEGVILPGEGKDFRARYFSGKFDLHQRAYLIYSKDTKQLCNKFLYFALIKHRKYFSATATGATVKSLRKPQIGALNIPCPPLAAQIKIAELLSNYEDLISTNVARIALLEDILKNEFDAIYADPKKVLVKQKLDSVVEVERGCTYSSEEIDDFEGTHKFVNLKSFIDGGGFRIDGTKFFSGKVKPAQFLNEGDIVMAVTEQTNARTIIAHPARIPQLDGTISFSADVVKVSSDSIPNTFLYQFLKSYKFTETTKHKANGTKVLHLKPSAILEFIGEFPDSQEITNFDNKAKSLTSEIHILLNQNLVLGTMLETLLEQTVAGNVALQ
jgi:type I restriction enzyme S subunit